MECKVPLMLYTDSDSLLKVIIKHSSTTERRRIIDLQICFHYMEATREAYGNHEITDIG